MPKRHQAKPRDPPVRGGALCTVAPPPCAPRPSLASVAMTPRSAPRRGEGRCDPHGRAPTPRRGTDRIVSREPQHPTPGTPPHTHQEQRRVGQGPVPSPTHLRGAPRCPATRTPRLSAAPPTAERARALASRPERWGGAGPEGVGTAP